MAAGSAFGEQLRQQMVALTCLLTHNLHRYFTKASSRFQHNGDECHTWTNLLSVDVPLGDLPGSGHEVWRECGRMAVCFRSGIDDGNIEQNTLGPVLDQYVWGGVADSDFLVTWRIGAADEGSDDVPNSVMPSLLQALGFVTAPAVGDTSSLRSTQLLHPHLAVGSVSKVTLL